MKAPKFVACVLTVLSASAGVAHATDASSDLKRSCAGLPSVSVLRASLIAAANSPNALNGLQLLNWATVVNRDGIVCAVAFQGDDRGAQWPGSRVISAQKANTANAFSLNKLALSTANLFSAVQPGGSLFGLQESNPVNTSVAYGGDSRLIGTSNDPMVGGKIGGVNVFGGGLALYDGSGTIIGGVGVSGDTSCRDHFVAWELRHVLKLDYVPSGVSGDPNRPDNIIFDIPTAQVAAPSPVPGPSTGGFGHPKCINTGNPAALDPIRHVSIASSH
ncbi:heme-binding protein [Hyphomicrobium sp.]|uniref:GlcG/HbpS family heme-binding protein n=1 Tax=Hyphomicrobium sp. TaxID=82 RepID=UPI0025C5CDFE|nr:heme-binding protein [Hyphomicrobium sp.]